MFKPCLIVGVSFKNNPSAFNLDDFVGARVGVLHGLNVGVFGV